MGPRMRYNRALGPRYYYSSRDSICIVFLYSGCGGNENNFVTMDECQARCGSNSAGQMRANQGTLGKAGTTTPKYFSKPGFPHCFGDEFRGDARWSTVCLPRDWPSDIAECEKEHHAALLGDPDLGVAICEETPAAKRQQVDTTLPVVDICTLPKKRGWCRARIFRFAYNPDTRQCEQFIFSGCRPNENNFATISACQERCDPNFPVCKKLCENSPIRETCEEFCLNVDGVDRTTVDESNHAQPTLLMGQCNCEDGRKGMLTSTGCRCEHDHVKPALLMGQCNCEDGRTGMLTSAGCNCEHVNCDWSEWADDTSGYLPQFGPWEMRRRSTQSECIRKYLEDGSKGQSEEFRPKSDRIKPALLMGQCNCQDGRKGMLTMTGCNCEQGRHDEQSARNVGDYVFFGGDGHGEQDNHTEHDEVKTGVHVLPPLYLSRPGFPHCFSNQISGDDGTHSTWCLHGQWPSHIVECEQEHHQALLQEPGLGVPVCEVPVSVALSDICEEDKQWKQSCNTCHCVKGRLPVCTKKACLDDVGYSWLTNWRRDDMFASDSSLQAKDVRAGSPMYLSRPGFPHCFSQEIRGDDRTFSTWCLHGQWPSHIVECEQGHHQALLQESALGVPICEGAPSSPCVEDMEWKQDCNMCHCVKGGSPVCTTRACLSDTVHSGIQISPPAYLSRPGFPHCFSQEIRGDDRTFSTWCLHGQWPSHIVECEQEHHQTLLQESALGVPICEGFVEEDTDNDGEEDTDNDSGDGHNDNDGDDETISCADLEPIATESTWNAPQAGDCPSEKPTTEECDVSHDDDFVSCRYDCSAVCAGCPMATEYCMYFYSCIGGKWRVAQPMIQLPERCEMGESSTDEGIIEEYEDEDHVQEFLVMQLELGHCVEGTTWMSDCNTCSCRENNVVACTKKMCPSRSGPNCNTFKDETLSLCPQPRCKLFSPEFSSDGSTIIQGSRCDEPEEKNCWEDDPPAHNESEVKIAYFYFDRSIRDCILFFYDGTSPRTRNMFDSYHECRTHCMDDVATTTAVPRAMMSDEERFGPRVASSLRAGRTGAKRGFGGTPGGLFEADLADESVLAAARHAVASMGPATDGVSCDELALHRVEKADKQVVAGINYVLRVHITEACDENVIRKICRNIRVHEPLPHVCTDCMELMGAHEISCEPAK